MISELFVFSLREHHWLVFVWRFYKDRTLFFFWSKLISQLWFHIEGERIWLKLKHRVAQETQESCWSSRTRTCGSPGWSVSAWKVSWPTVMNFFSKLLQILDPSLLQMSTAPHVYHGYKSTFHVFNLVQSCFWVLNCAPSPPLPPRSLRSAEAHGTDIISSNTVCLDQADKSPAFPPN